MLALLIRKVFAAPEATEIKQNISTSGAAKKSSSLLSEILYREIKTQRSDLLGSKIVDSVLVKWVDDKVAVL
jgi:hypothetical protein